MNKIQEIVRWSNESEATVRQVLSTNPSISVEKLCDDGPGKASILEWAWAEFYRTLAMIR
jgi:hypothetical protein